MIRPSTHQKHQRVRSSYRDNDMNHKNKLDQHKKELSSNGRVLRRLRKACDRAKRALSTPAQNFIGIDSFVEGMDMYTSITNSRFEETCKDFSRMSMDSEKSRKGRPIDKKSISAPSFGSEGSFGGYVRNSVVEEPFDHGNLLGNQPERKPSIKRSHSLGSFVSSTFQKTPSQTPGPPINTSLGPKKFTIKRPLGMNPDETEIHHLRRMAARPRDVSERLTEMERKKKNDNAIRRLHKKVAANIETAKTAATKTS